MEKDENRHRFYLEVPAFVSDIRLSKELLRSLEKDAYFGRYYETLRKFSTNREKLLYILMVMIRERETFRKLVQFLSDSGQTSVAEKLSEFNESKGPMQLSLAIELEVMSVTAPKKDLSSCYNLLRKPRGKCIIINNVEEQQTPDVLDKQGNLVFRPKGLENETKRFRHVFKQLYFEVQVLTKLSATQMSEQLIQISKDQSLKQDEAFVLIVITHGADEQVLGYNACEAARKIRFKEVSGPGIQEAEQEMDSDVIGIKQIVEIFSEDNCDYLKSKPKLYFYICCRVKSCNDSAQQSTQRQPTDDNNSELVKENIKKLSGRVNLDTFISYACSEGYESFFREDWGMSYFGQAFTHSIAQYARDEPLGQIMGRTSTRLKKLYSDIKEKEEQDYRDGRGDEPSTAVGSFAIEVNTYAMDRQLYFNPGIVDNSENMDT